ncbi:cytochrome c4 [Halioglobus japonicus]|uniref:Cytochrome c4 n=1 Tax=Halioglobus japonicus TaxID=930805 RepID=A0AAP8SM54_9GAMM|nr:c-type cytochrome [Halioglobus japonicus]AQA17291.1 cytochrome c4 [Halioglobus japonicus]PLW85215.1 cytochrome c4 [Halioglobus japonicus]
MKKVVILASLILGWTQVASAQTGDAAAGKDMTTMCAACHGADGNSAAATFPKLAGLGEKYLLKQLKDIRDGARPIPTMVGQVDDKSDQELADIAAFYASQPRSGGQADPELIALGAKVYRSGVAERNVAACTACHSPNGNGNAPAGFPALAGQHADYIAAQLKAYRLGYEDDSGRTNDGETKIMRTTAFGLSDKEIEAVSSYISGLK